MSKRPRRPSDQGDHLFSPGNDSVAQEAQPPGKYAHLDSSTDSSNAHQVICCSLPPHPSITFSTYQDYEVHYNKSHVNRCLDCAKNFPTDHFLSLHIAENHDPLIATKRDRGDKTYRCFVQDCDKVCSTWQKRRMHLVDKHMFPKNYAFSVVNDGLDHRHSLLRPAHGGNHPKKPNFQTKAKSDSSRQETAASLTATDRMDMDDGEDKQSEPPIKEVSMDDITDSMSALKFVPKSVTFGRGKQRGGFARS